MARDFDGASSQYIRAASAVLTGVPITMACWFRPAGVASHYGLMSLSDESAATSYFVLEAAGTIGGDPLRCTTRLAVEANALTTTGFSANTWHHACGVWSAADARAAYIDGGSKGTNAVAITPTNLDITVLGARARNPYDSFFDGLIAEAGIWNIALTDAEVAILAAGYSPLLVRPQNLVLYAPLIRDIQDTVGGLTLANTGTTVGDHCRVIHPASPQTFGLSRWTNYVPDRFGRHPTEDPVRVDTGRGAPAFAAPPGTLYLDLVAMQLYVNGDGAVDGWTAI